MDLLVLEGLALYEPGVYRELSQAFDDLFPGSYVDFRDFILSRRGKAGEKGTTRIQSLNKIAMKPQGTTWLEVAAVLKLLLGVEGSDFADVDAKESSHRIRFRRFSEGRFFRRYFRLSIDSGDVSKATIQSLVMAIGTPGRFPKQLTDLEGQGVLLDALDQMLAENLSPPQALSLFLSDLLDWWEERVLRRGSVKEDTGLAHSLIRLYEHLMGTRGGKERGSVLQAMLKQTNSVFALRDLVFHEQRKRRQREVSKSSDTSMLMDKEAELELCQEVARRILQHFKNHPPTGRPYENEACTWTTSFKGSWQSDIGGELLRTAGGVATLLRGILERMGSLPSKQELRDAGEILAPIAAVEALYQATSQHREALIQLGEDVDDRLDTLDRIREAVASGGTGKGREELA